MQFVFWLVWKEVFLWSGVLFLLDGLGICFGFTTLLQPCFFPAHLLGEGRRLPRFLSTPGFSHGEAVAELWRQLAKSKRGDTPRMVQRRQGRWLS